jgi:hypothetical protein
MRRTSLLLIVVAAASLAACAIDPTAPSSLRAAAPASARVVSSGPADVGVITTVYDADASNAALLTEGDDNGIGFATYSPIGGVHNSLTSHVSADGSWQLYIGNQTVRTLHLLLADAGLPFANGYYWSSVEVASRCVDQAGNALNIQLLAAGASFDNCSLIVDFDIGTKKKTTYKLAMGPNFANTGRASVTCNATGGSYCTSWTIVPNDAAPDARVAILTAGNGTTSLDGKLYTNSYRIAATKQ